MKESLVAFDFEAFKADPSRLRTIYGERPEWAEAVRGCVVVQWPSNMQPVVYVARHFPEHVRLVAKTRTIRVRLCDYGKGKLTARTSDLYDLTASHCHGDPWIGDEFEREIPA